MSDAGSLAVIALLVGIVGAVWVFADASENSSQSAFLWGLVALLGGLLGVLLYVLVGRDGGTSGGSTGGRTRSEPARGTAKISHRCRTCGEKFYAPDREIRSCHNCGGIKIEEV